MPIRQGEYFIKNWEVIILIIKIPHPCMGGGLLFCLSRAILKSQIKVFGYGAQG